MITVMVCVGSSCHVKGARGLIERFDEIVRQHGLRDKVTLKGSFCMERCGEGGVNWQIDAEQFTSPNQEHAVAIFREKVLKPCGVAAGAGPDGKGRE
ncbi:MAG: (2Fe-2S) ferredoxin domain-containing protein [Phycisphaerae bacterium]